MGEDWGRPPEARGGGPRAGLPAPGSEADGWGQRVRDVVPLACAWRGTGICIHPKGVTRRANGTIMLGRWAGPSWQAQQAKNFFTKC